MGTTRERMIADLTLAGLSMSTRRLYLRYAAQLVKHYMRPAEALGEAEVQAFLLHLREERKLKTGTLLIVIAALKFLYRVTLKRPEVMGGMRFPRHRTGRVAVPTRAEVRALFAAAPTPYWRMFFRVAYATGLRRTEIASLCAADIDAASGLIHVRHGKGDKAREVMLDPTLLTELRAHWKTHRLPGPYLFPGQRKGGSKAPVWQPRPVHLSSATGALRAARKAAGLKRPITLHGLRHAFATHLLEDGLDLATLRRVLGHEDLATTLRYTEVTTDRIRAIRSPLATLEPAP